MRPLRWGRWQRVTHGGEYGAIGTAHGETGRQQAAEPFYRRLQLLYWSIGCGQQLAQQGAYPVQQALPLRAWGG